MRNKFIFENWTPGVWNEFILISKEWGTERILFFKSNTPSHARPSPVIFNGFASICNRRIHNRVWNSPGRDRCSMALGTWRRRVVYSSSFQTKCEYRRKDELHGLHAIKYRDFVWTILAVYKIERFVDVLCFDEWSSENRWEEKYRRLKITIIRPITIDNLSKYSNWSIPGTRILLYTYNICNWRNLFVRNHNRFRSHKSKILVGTRGIPLNRLVCDSGTIISQRFYRADWRSILCLPIFRTLLANYLTSIRDFTSIFTNIKLLNDPRTS